VCAAAESSYCWDDIDSFYPASYNLSCDETDSTADSMVLIGASRCGTGRRAVSSFVHEVSSGAIVSQSTPASTLPVTTKSRQYLEFLALCLASIVFWWHPVVSTLNLALNNDAYTHILLILPVSLALILAEPASPPTVGSEKWAGWTLLSTAMLLRALAFWSGPNLSTANALSLSIFALVLWWIGSAAACFGMAPVRSHLFASCLLFLLVPLPAQAVNWMIEGLQNGSAVAADALFRIAQVPVTRQGIILSIPGLDIEVARECSSIRSSAMLIVITLVLAHLFLRSNWRKLALVLMAVPICIGKNALRIFTIAELATRVDPGYLDGNLHHHGGVVFLALAGMITVVLLWFLRKGEFQRRSTR
jgi:exosortase